jgi:hypothetical protein
MIRTYALDPAVTSDAMAFVAFVQGLGIENGRVLAEFPRSWVALALPHVRSVSSVRDRKRIEELLQRIRVNGLIKVRTGLPFDGHRPWLKNAVENIDRFDAVIYADESSRPAAHERLHAASSLLDEPEFWQVARRVEFVSARGNLARLLTPLLVLDRHIAIMDPFFNPRERRYLTGLNDILASVQPSTSLVVHASTEVVAGASPLSTKEWEDACQTACLELANLESLQIVRWAGRDGVGRLHDRWVVTPRGGIELGRGIATGRMKNMAALLPAQAALGFWRTYGRTPFAESEFEIRDSVQLL